MVTSEGPGPSFQATKSGIALGLSPQPPQTSDMSSLAPQHNYGDPLDSRREQTRTSLLGRSTGDSTIGVELLGTSSASQTSESQPQESSMFGGIVNTTNQPQSQKWNFSDQFRFDNPNGAVATSQSGGAASVVRHGPDTAAESRSIFGRTEQSSTESAPPSQAVNKDAPLSFDFEPRVQLFINSPFSSQGPMFEGPRDNAFGGPEGTSTVNGLSSRSSSNAASPSYVFGSAGKSSTSDALFDSAATSATVGSQSGSIKRPAAATTPTSQPFGKASLASSAKPKTSTSGDAVPDGTARANPNQIDPPGLSISSAGQAAQGPYMTGPFFQHSQNTAIAGTLVRNVQRHQAPGSNIIVPLANVSAPAPSRPQVHTATSATINSTPRSPANTALAATIQTQGTVIVASANSTSYQSQQNVTAPPANATTNHPQTRVAAPPPNLLNSHPQPHVAGPALNAATNHPQTNAAPRPPVPVNYFYHQPVPIHPPSAANQLYQRNPNAPPYVVTATAPIAPNTFRTYPVPILATRVFVRPSGPGATFRTSDHRSYTSFGQVDPVVWSQLQLLGQRNGLRTGQETLLSSDGTLYLRGPDPVRPAAPRPRRRRGSSPDAVAGRNIEGE